MCFVSDTSNVSCSTELSSKSQFASAIVFVNYINFSGRYEN